MNQSRRNFLKLSRVLPLAAVPVLATSGWALIESDRAARVLQQIQMTKDGVYFQGCRFSIGGGFLLHGNGQTLANCIIEHKGDSGVRILAPQPTMAFKGLSYT